MRYIKYILVLFICAICAQTAVASAKLASYNGAAVPVTSMRSTSTMFRSSAPQSYRNTQTFGVQQTSISVVNWQTNMGTKRSYSAAQSGTVNVNRVSLPVLAITERNIAYAEQSFAGEEENAYTAKPRPRKVSGDNDDDNPGGPMEDGNYTPIGETPYVMMLILAITYIILTIRRRKKRVSA